MLRKTVVLALLLALLLASGIPYNPADAINPIPLPEAAAPVYVCGNVTNSTGGLPVAGTNVSFFNATSGLLVNSTQTNESGFYNITVEAGIYNISVRAADHYTTLVVNFNASANSSLDMVIDEIPGRIEGIVDDGWHLLSGIRLNITLGNGTVISATTNESGNFALWPLPWGEHTVTVNASGYPNITALASVAWNSTTILNVRMTGSTMEGYVHDDSGTPVVAEIKIENGSAWFNTTSDSAGHYSVSGLRQGFYSIRAVKAGYVTDSRTGIEVGSGETVVENLTLTGAGVAGRVYDDGGRSIAGASVVLYLSGSEYASTVSNSTGEFGLQSLPAGTYTLSVSKSGYLSNQSTISVNAGSVLKIDPVLVGGLAYGQVTDDAGRPVFLATVEVIGTGYTAETNETGHYLIEGIPEGNYYLKASCEGYLSAITDSPLYIAAGEGVPTNFTLRGGTIMGTVQNASSFLAGASISIIISQEKLLSATSDEAGRYVIGGIPTGIYAVMCDLEGYQNVTVGGVSVIAGQTTTLDINMEELTGAISGHVVSGSEGLEGVEVWVAISDGVRLAYTDENGNYTITNVPAGSYTVTAEKTGYYTAIAEGVGVKRGETTRYINFTMEGKLSSLAGSVSNGTYPIVGVMIEILEIDYSTYTDPFGRYVLENVPPGTYTVIATKQGYQANASYGVTISRGETVALNFTLEEIPGIVWGFVKDDEGNPIIEATVEVIGTQYSTTTDAYGYYKLAGIPPGVYSLRFYKSGYSEVVETGVDITREVDKHVDITLSTGDGVGGLNGPELIPGYDLVHSFMIFGLITVLVMMMISILYMHRHGKRLSGTGFMQALKEAFAQEEAEKEDDEQKDAIEEGEEEAGDREEEEERGKDGEKEEKPEQKENTKGKNGKKKKKLKRR